jgi:hypothetical protein
MVSGDLNFAEFRKYLVSLIDICLADVGYAGMSCGLFGSRRFGSFMAAFAG